MVKESLAVLSTQLARNATRGHASAIGFRNPAEVVSLPGEGEQPRNLVDSSQFHFLSIPAILIHANDCSTRLRFR
jgi:hypothetical protein